MQKIFRIAALFYFISGVLASWLVLFSQVLGIQPAVDILQKSSQRSILSAIAAAALSVAYAHKRQK